MFKYNNKIVLLVNFTGESEGGCFSPEFHIYNELSQLVATGASAPYHENILIKKLKE